MKRFKVLAAIALTTGVLLSGCAGDVENEGSEGKENPIEENSGDEDEENSDDGEDEDDDEDESED